MNFEEALRYELIQIGGMANKVFPLFSKEGVIPPYIVYISSEGVFTRTFSGYHVDKEIDCELHVVASTYQSMKTLLKQVINCIQSFQGRIIGDNLFCYEVKFEMPEEFYEEELNLYHSVFEITVRI